MTETIFKLMKSKTDFIEMKTKDNEFRMYTRKHESGSECVLYRVVDGAEHYMKEIKSYKEGTQYIQNQYHIDWDAFTLFADTLHDEIREQMYLLNYEPYGEIQTSRHITVLGVSCKLWLIVKCGEEFISEVKVDHVDVLNDDSMDELCNYFVYEFYKIIAGAFTCEIA